MEIFPNGDCPFLNGWQLSRTMKSVFLLPVACLFVSCAVDGDVSPNDLDRRTRVDARLDPLSKSSAEVDGIPQQLEERRIRPEDLQPKR